MSDGSFEVTKKMFETSPISHCGGMHGSTGLVDGIGDVRTSEGEILKRPDNSSVEARMIRRRGARGRACRGTGRGKRFTLLYFKHLKDRESVVLLGEGEAVTMLLKFNSKEARRGSEIFEPEMSMKRGNEVVDFRGGRADDENVIDVNENVERASGSIEERGISFGSLKAEGKELPGEFLIPFPRGLFEAIEGLAKKTNMMRVLRMVKARGLIHVDELMKITVEKGVGYV